MQERINIVQSDLFAALGDRVYDVILTNPPYVGSGEMAGLPPEYRHEPRLGLETGREGLEIPLRILASAGDYLSEHGVLFLEVGYGWPRLEDALPGVPLTWVELERGGEGILVMQAAELLEHRAAFQQALEER
jgi:ribosomal protein L3 glutamine methyltransferase